MHDCSTHVHNDFNAEKLNKEQMNTKLNDINKFKGFDDFMYFAYKYWLLIKDNPEDISKTQNLFTEAAKKFNKLNGIASEKIQEESIKFVSHLNEITSLLFEAGDVHNATVNITKFVKPYTIQDKFIRNFNKKLASSEI